MDESNGQHSQTGSGAPGESAGQTSILQPRVNVGNQSGGETHDSVPGDYKPSADISTERRD